GTRAVLNINDAGFVRIHLAGAVDDFASHSPSIRVGDGYTKLDDCFSVDVPFQEVDDLLGDPQVIGAAREWVNRQRSNPLNQDWHDPAAASVLGLSIADEAG